MDIVRFESLTKIYRLPGFLKTKEVLGIRDLTLGISQGEIFGLLGLNGSGKTTTIRLLLGLIRPTSGRASVMGKDSALSPEVRAHLGYLPENVSFPAVLSANEILKFFARLTPDHGRNVEQRIPEALQAVGLGGAAHRKTATYSKGMIQRLGVAQAILHRPKVLVLDEPASGLDPLATVRMRELFVRLNQEGMTVIFSSHSIGEVEKIAHRVAIITGNRLQRVLNRAEWTSGGKSLETHFLECAETLEKEASSV